ncbi:MAG: hypothetical protein U0230_24805 [Polyangiales bacterium]
MRFLASFLGGLPFGLLSVGVLLYALLLPEGRHVTAPDDVELLRPGARAWSTIEAPAPGECTGLFTLASGEVAITDAHGASSVLDLGSRRWRSSSLVQPRPPFAPSGLDGKWFAFSADRQFVLRNGACRLELAPEGDPTPELSPCPARAIEVEGAARLSDGSTLVVRYDASANRHRGQVLPAGATTWRDLGLLDVPTTAGELHPGPGGRAIFVSGSGRIALYDGGAFRTLPEHSPRRYAQNATIAGDGTVVVCGGQKDVAVENRLLAFGLPFALFVVGLVLAFVAVRRFHASLPGIVVGWLAGAFLACAGIVTVFFMAGGGP